MISSTDDEDGLLRIQAQDSEVLSVQAILPDQPIEDTIVAEDSGGGNRGDEGVLEGALIKDTDEVLSDSDEDEETGIVIHAGRTTSVTRRQFTHKIGVRSYTRSQYNTPVPVTVEFQDNVVVGKTTTDEMQRLRFQKNITAFDVDIDALDSHPWRNKNADISDYFNYGFNEKTWLNYCEQQLRLRAKKGLGPQPGYSSAARASIVVPPAVAAVTTTITPSKPPHSALQIPQVTALPVAPIFPPPPPPPGPPAQPSSYASLQPSQHHSLAPNPPLQQPMPPPPTQLLPVGSAVRLESTTPGLPNGAVTAEMRPPPPPPSQFPGQPFKGFPSDSGMSGLPFGAPSFGQSGFPLIPPPFAGGMMPGGFPPHDHFFNPHMIPGGSQSFHPYGSDRGDFHRGGGGSEGSRGLERDSRRNVGDRDRGRQRDGWRRDKVDGADVELNKSSHRDRDSHNGGDRDRDRDRDRDSHNGGESDRDSRSGGNRDRDRGDSRDRGDKSINKEKNRGKEAKSSSKRRREDDDEVEQGGSMGSSSREKDRYSSKVLDKDGARDKERERGGKDRDSRRDSDERSSKHRRRSPG